MASTATATATMAAAGFDKRASTASSFLTTPGSASFPSELCSPSVGSPGFLRRETDLRTPITPPSAYLDFLKNMSPAMLSPAPTSACARFSFNERPIEIDTGVRDDKKLSISPPMSQPPLSRNTSYDSNASTSTSATEHSVSTTASNSSAGRSKARPESPRVIIPPSPFVKPGPMSARTPRRLHIPQSPFSPAMPTSQSLKSPFASTPLSATPWSATQSPRDKDLDGTGKRVCVRQVVTRTVTYCRTPLEPAPRGKRRKIEIHPPTPVAEAVTEAVTVKSEASDDYRPEPALVSLVADNA